MWRGHDEDCCEGGDLSKRSGMLAYAFFLELFFGERVAGTHYLGKPSQGWEQSGGRISLAVDPVEDNDEAEIVGTGGVFEHLGQLNRQLRHRLASWRPCSPFQRISHLSNEGFEEVSCCNAFYRVDDGEFEGRTPILRLLLLLLLLSVLLLQELEEGARDGCFPGGFSAVDNDILTGCCGRLSSWSKTTLFLCIELFN